MRIKIPPRLACVATLPCETLMSAKQAINDKLQGSVAAYLRCGGVVNNQKKDLHGGACCYWCSFCGLQSHGFSLVENAPCGLGGVVE